MSRRSAERRGAAPWLSIASTLAVAVALGGCVGYPTVSAPWSHEDAPPGEYEPQGLPEVPMVSTDGPGPGVTEPGASDGVLDRVIVDAYTEAHRLADAAHADPASGTDQLADGFVDPLLALITGRVQDLADRGVEVHNPSGAPPAGQVLFTATDGSTATARACVVDDGVEVDIATGEAVAGGESSTLRDVELVEVDGTWKIANEVVLDEWPDLEGCRLAG